MPAEPPFDFVPTEKAGELSFWVLVNSHDITTTNLPEEDGVTMGGFALPTAARPHSSYDPYIFKFVSPGATAGYLRFHFVKPDGPPDEGQTLTPEQLVPYRVFERTNTFDWDAVLEEPPVFTADSKYMVSAPYGDLEGNYEGRVMVPRVYVSHRFRPAWKGPTVFRHELFLSASKWPRDALRHSSPQPTEVRIEVPGLGEYVLPKCLHPEIQMNYRPKYRLVRQVSGATSVRSVAAPQLPDVSIPATNFRRWRPFVVSDEQSPTETGKWRREKITAFPPSPVPITENG